MEQSLTSYALKLLARRAYTTHAITKKLRFYAQKKNIPESDRDSAIQKTLSALTGWGYLNDHQFAAQFIRSRMTTKPKSLRALEYELRRKGVTQDVARAATQTSGFTDQTAAEKVLARHNQTLKKLPEDKRRAKVYRLLKTRGFSGSLVTDIMQTFFD